MQRRLTIAALILLLLCAGIGIWHLLRPDTPARPALSLAQDAAPSANTTPRSQVAAPAAVADNKQLEPQAPSPEPEPVPEEPAKPATPAKEPADKPRQPYKEFTVRVYARVVDEDGQPVAGANAFVEVELAATRDTEATVRPRMMLGPSDADGLLDKSGGIGIGSANLDAIHGVAKIRALKDGYLPSEAVEIQLGGYTQTPTETQLVLRTPGFLRGRLVDPEGKPVLSVMLRVGRARTDADGNFKTEPLPAGGYVIEPVHEGYAITPATPFDVTRGQTTDCGTLVATKRPAITGSILRAPASLVGSPFSCCITLTDSAGHDFRREFFNESFTIGNIAPGTYTLNISAAGYKPHEQTNVVVVASEWTNLNPIFLARSE